MRSARAVIAALVIAAAAAYGVIYGWALAPTPIRSDAFSYFVYLPAVVVHGDPSLRRVAVDCCGGRFPRFTAIIRWPGTGRFVNAHPIGVAVLVLPLYLLAHGLTWWMHLPPDGFTLLYTHLTGLGGVVYFGIGLTLLWRLLRRTFDAGVSLATILVVALGTNLFHYATWDSLYSHVYAFALLTALMLLLPDWTAQPTARRSVLLGAVGGLLVLVRHPHILWLLLIPLYGVLRPSDLAARTRWLLHHWRAVIVVLLATIAVILPQLLLYHAATGRWMVSSYGELWFTFDDPKLFGVLLSARKGLFFYSPVLLLALPGWFLMRGEAAGYRTGSLLLLSLHTYIVASWWDWQFGASYGHRAFTDVLAIFALPLAASLEWLGRLRWRALAVPVVGALVVLSVAQMIQVWLGTLPMSDLTWAEYQARFLRFR